jgi:putative transposase
MNIQEPLPKRKYYMRLGEIFFWTATINNWQRLLWEDSYKKIIIGSLDYLSENGLVDIFSFVIMPTHLHLIWRANDLNGKESPQGSFLKFTAHQFKKSIIRQNPSKLLTYRSDAVNKSYEFWQRDPLAIHLYTKKVAIQKLTYIHNNPLAGRWRLVKDPCDYKYSSAKYYLKNQKEFRFLKDLYEEF